MLVSKEVEMKWNSKNKKRYEEFGYVYTKMRELFMVKVEHLPQYSKIYVGCECDYCGEPISKTYGEYLRQHEYINKDCCNKNECKVTKQEETMMILYGETNISKTEYFKEKYKEVMLENYGVDNYFRIYDTKMENNYWFKPTYATCAECGTVFHRKESHINRSELNFCDRECMRLYYTTNYEACEYKYPRSTTQYKNWRNQVLERDDYKCIICGSDDRLEVHHLDSMQVDISKTFDVDNGIVLCVNHHNAKIKGGFHNIFGTHFITKEHFYKYLDYLNIKIEHSCLE